MCNLTVSTRLVSTKAQSMALKSFFCTTQRFSLCLILTLMLRWRRDRSRSSVRHVSNGAAKDIKSHRFALQTTGSQDLSQVTPKWEFSAKLLRSQHSFTFVITWWKTTRVEFTRAHTKITCSTFINYPEIGLLTQPGVRWWLTPAELR